MKLSYEQALHKLAAYCSRGERCTADLRKKMTNWELLPADQNKIIDYLSKQGFVDEVRYARAFVHDKNKHNGWGIYKIAFELKNKSIPKSIIDEALTTIDPTDNKERLVALLQQKHRSVKAKNEYELRQKLTRFALGRGFTINEIEYALQVCNFSF
ncbi:RecX family transcriptional regulator [Bacteroidales bacterium OttesenSCG-928-M11]|nr:RecX family transcriptional regulator [Bacteroidales bacterium OttesenSCG-928-M11]